MSVGKNFFDQYSVFCVFGSVVGCVVVPLIAQSVECVIFSALVISLTAATHLNKKTNAEHNSKLSNYHTAEKKKTKEGVNSGSNKRKREKQHQHLRQQFHPQNELLVEKQIQHMIREEEMKTLAMEERNNLKRAKKAKKREERLQRKETKTKETSCHQSESQGQNSIKNYDCNKQDSKSNMLTTGIAIKGKDKINKRHCSRPPRFDGGRSPTLGNSFSNAYSYNNNNYTVKTKSSHNCGRTKSMLSSSETMSLSMRSSLSASNSSLSSIGSLTLDSHELSSPPPSVWKLPPKQDVEPVWFPGSAHEMGTSNKNSKQLHTAKQVNTLKEAYKSTELAGKEDIANSKVVNSGFSSLFVAHGKSNESMPHNNVQMESTREYSLFGPNHLDQVLSQTPSLLIK